MFCVYLAHADHSTSDYHEAVDPVEAESTFRGLLRNAEYRGLHASAVIRDDRRPLYAVPLDGPVDPDMHINLKPRARAAKS